MSKPPSTFDTAPRFHPIKITLNFSLQEFRQPALYGLPEEPYPAEWIADRLTPLCQLLEVIRAVWGKPMTILPGGGYRTAEWNERHRRAGHGAALNTQHVQGRAADIRVEGVPAVEVHAAVLWLYREGKLPDLGGLGEYDSFVHVDVRPHQPGKLARWKM